MICLSYVVSSLLLSTMLEADALGDVSRLGDKLLLFKGFSLPPPVAWLLIVESVAQRKTPMLDWLPVIHAGLSDTDTYSMQGEETTVCSSGMCLLHQGRKTGVVLSNIPTTSHPGRGVGFRASFSPMRAAAFMCRKVAVSDFDWCPGPRPGRGSRRPNQSSIMMERVQESVGFPRQLQVMVLMYVQRMWAGEW